MNRLKMFALSALVLSGVLVVSGQVLADMAPPSPGFPSIHVNVKVGLGKLSNQYVMIYQAHQSLNQYSVAQGNVSPGVFSLPNYFALDKKYFDEQGGINGLFKTVPAEFDGQAFQETVPKDAASFNAHRYNFVVSNNDPLLAMQSGYDQNKAQPVGDTYKSFPFSVDFFIRQGTDDENCDIEARSPSDKALSPLKNCVSSEKTLVYMPQQVVGKNIVLADSITINQQMKKEVKAPQPEVQPIVLPVEKHSRWSRVWQWFKSLL